MGRPLALVVDADPGIRAQISDMLEDRDVRTLGAGTGADGADYLRHRPIELFVCGIATPGAEALDLIGHALRLDPAPIVIAIEGAGGDAARWLRAGVFDVLAQPLDTERLEATIDRVLRQRALLDELLGLRDTLRRRTGFGGLVGRTASMLRIRDELERLAAALGPVWFVGEAGSGRLRAARELHQLSPRRDAAFVVADAGSGTNGWARAAADAAGGTLVLANVDRMQPAAQVRAFGPVDPTGPTRIAVTSSLDPAAGSERGVLDPELTRRLSGVEIRMPPLRERRSDIVLLAREFVGEICRINHIPPLRLDPATLALLEGYRWPGNVRELRQAMEQAVILATDGIVRPRDLPEALRRAESVVGRPRAAVRPRADRPFRDAKRDVVDAFEREYLAELLERHVGNVTSASQQAGMLRSALQRLLRKHGLRSAEFRASGAGRARSLEGEQPAPE